MRGNVFIGWWGMDIRFDWMNFLEGGASSKTLLLLKTADVCLMMISREFSSWRCVISMVVIQGRTLHGARKCGLITLRLRGRLIKPPSHGVKVPKEIGRKRAAVFGAVALTKTLVFSPL
jgi:hypothetical protein